MMTTETGNDWRKTGLQVECSDIKAVGTWLKSARELRGETLDDISRVTRIGKSYLAAIEDGLIAKLPSSAYTRGFIRLYAAHLGLSPDEALLMLDRAQPAPVDKTADELDSAANRAQQIIDKPVAAKRNRLLLLLALSVCIAAALFLFSPAKNLVLPEKPAPSALQAPGPAENAQKNKADFTAADKVPVPAAVVDGNNSESPAADGIVLRLKAVRDGRLHITIDGAVSQEYDLVAGDLVEWKAEKAFLLDIENSASVEGELNGVPLKPFGEPGKPAHMLINVDGAHNE